MSDLAEWNVHGPVETLRTEFAEWDPAKQNWKPAKLQKTVRFRPDGRTLSHEFYDGDGSISRTTYIYDETARLAEMRFQLDEKPGSRLLYFYDPTGRPASTVTIDENGERYESEAYHYDANGRKTKLQFPPKNATEKLETATKVGAGQFIAGPLDNTVTTYYDERDRPTEILFHNPSHVLVQRQTFTYDSSGRLLTEQTQFGEGWFAFGSQMEALPPEHREQALAAFRSALDHANEISYRYDEKGRLSEKIMHLFGLSEERTTYNYDDRDNPIEEITQESSHEMEIDEQGNLHPAKESSHEQHTRYTYKYDSQGNWTERLVWMLPQNSTDFHRSNIERRLITYYPTTQP